MLFFSFFEGIKPCNLFYKPVINNEIESASLFIKSTYFFYYHGISITNKTCIIFFVMLFSSNQGFYHIWYLAPWHLRVHDAYNLEPKEGGISAIGHQCIWCLECSVIPFDNCFVGSYIKNSLKHFNMENRNKSKVKTEFTYTSTWNNQKQIQKSWRIHFRIWKSIIVLDDNYFINFLLLKFPLQALNMLLWSHWPW